MTEPRFILRTRGSRINPAIRWSPVTSRSRAIPETDQFVTERTERAGEKRVGDPSRLAARGGQPPKTREIPKIFAVVQPLQTHPPGMDSLEAVGSNDPVAGS